MNITNVKELDKQIKSNPALLIYFSSPSCSVCQAVKPKLLKNTKERFPKMKCMEVDISVSAEVGASLNILAAPTVIIFLDGKEFIRKTRVFSSFELLDEIQRPYDIFFT